VKKFKFRFRALLEAKRDREDQKKRELSELMRAKEMQQQALNRLRGRVDRCREEMRRLCLSDGTAAMVALAEECLMRLAEETEAQRRVVAEAAQRVEEKRRELVQVSKERRILEKLQERERAEFEARAEAAEQRLMDEISLNKYVRNMSDREGEYAKP